MEGRPPPDLQQQDLQEDLQVTIYIVHQHLGLKKCMRLNLWILSIPWDKLWADLSQGKSNSRIELEFSVLGVAEGGKP